MFGKQRVKEISTSSQTRAKSPVKMENKITRRQEIEERWRKWKRVSRKKTKWVLKKY